MLAIQSGTQAALNVATKRALVLPNFLVICGGNFELADSTINLTPAFCSQALAAANWYTNTQVLFSRCKVLLSFVQVLPIVPP